MKNKNVFYGICAVAVFSYATFTCVDYGYSWWIPLLTVIIAVAGYAVTKFIMAMGEV